MPTFRRTTARSAPLQGGRQTGHRRMGERGRAGHAVHQPLRERDRRGDHQGAGGRLSGSRHGGMGPSFPHRHRRARDPRTHRGSSGIMFQARPGGGASPAGDGWPSAGEWHSVGGIKFGSLEVAEARFPLLFIRHEFRPDFRRRRTVSWRSGRAARAFMIETAEPRAREHGRRRRAPWLAGLRRLTTASLIITFCTPTRARSPRCRTKEIGIEAFVRATRFVIAFGRRRRLGRSGGRSAAQHAADRLSGLVTDRRTAHELHHRHRRRRHIHRPGGDRRAAGNAPPRCRRRRRIHGVGLFDGLDELARRLGVYRQRELLRDAHRVIHGTTVATNALLEGKGAQHRHAGDGRPPRHPRDARGPEASRSLQPAHAAAGAAGAAASAARRARAHGHAGRVAVPLDPASLDQRDRPACVPQTSMRWRSVSCTASAIRATSRSQPTRSAPRCPTPLCRCRRMRSTRRSRSSSGSPPRSSMPMWARKLATLSCRGSARLKRRRPRGPALHHAVPWRGGAG